MKYTISEANTHDLDKIEALLPRLADFDVPTHRVREHLWHGDRDMVRDWAAGKRDDVNAIVATSQDERKIIGVAVISFRKELLSGDPSAHLEVLALDKSAEGHGIATALMQEAEKLASSNGALSMSLHVFANNTRARALYERKGFDGELMRYYKPLTLE